ncbi:MAG: radical SAM/SPASM domain-containing protein [Alphaproteobacteria bacterium]
MPEFFDRRAGLPLPQMVELELTDSCNLRCHMCHVSYMPHERKTLLDPELIAKLAPLKGAYISIASGFEPMMHPEFGRIMGDLSDLDLNLQIITNGTYCDKRGIGILLDARMRQINFSFDGIRKETYERIRRRADYERTLENILATRAAFAGRDTSLAINYTTVRSNLTEVVEAVDFWDERGFDILRFLVMVVRYSVPELLRESLYPISEEAQRVFDAAARRVIEGRLKIAIWRLYHLNSEITRLHPRNCRGNWVISDHPDARFVPNYREQYLLPPDLRLAAYGCRAPLNSLTILASGDVQLCYKYTIGNLHEQDIESIWYGEKAEQVRAAIARSRADCDACDCYRFGIALEVLNAEEIEAHFNSELHPFLAEVDFEAGRLPASRPVKPPRLVETIGNYNIVEYGSRYFGIPHTAGPIEVDKTDLSVVPGVVADDRYARVLHRVRALAGRPKA